MTTEVSKYIREGDIVRISDPIERIQLVPGSTFEGEARNAVEFIIASILYDENDVPVIFVDADEEPHELENREIKVIDYANHLPDAGYITWMDYDHQQQVAFRDGHPLNNVWVSNSKRYNAADLKKSIGSANIHILELAGV